MDLKVPLSAPLPPLKVPRARLQIGRLQLLALLALLLASNFIAFGFFFQPQRLTKLPLHSENTLARCRALHVKPAPAPSFNLRTKSDRFQPGTRAVLIKNATIWTGRVEGLEVLKGDIFMDGGIIVAVGVIEQSVLDLHEHDIVDAQVCNMEQSWFSCSDPLQGAWVTPGSVCNLSRYNSCIYPNSGLSICILILQWNPLPFYREPPTGIQSTVWYYRGCAP